MIALLPRISVVSVVGTLSSSTQMYSGSLATSPKRGFLMRSHRGSADLMSIVGSACWGSPTTWRTWLHPARSTSTRTPQRRPRVSMRTYHSTGSILGPGLPRESLLLGHARGQESLTPRKQGGSRDRRDPGHVEIEHALALEQDGDNPARDLEVARNTHRALGTRQHLLHSQRPPGEDVRDRQRVDDHEALGAL